MSIKTGGSRSVIGVICSVALLLLVSGCDCPPPEQRPGSSYDGSVHWALDAAQPVIHSFASDAEIYQVLGAVVWNDGRLPANSGSWSFVSWSPSRREICQVTVNWLGNARERVRESVDPPRTGSGGPIPSAWVNSTAVFSGIPSNEVTASFAQLVVFNLNNHDEAPNAAVWGINFAGGNNPLVRWDGVYVGNQFD